MKSFIMRAVGLLAFLLPSISFAAATSGGIDQAIESFVLPFTDFIATIVFYAVPIGGIKVPLILGWLIAVALFTRRL
jgi:alanine or glycine:cation symporter, AGCS family